MKKKIINKRVNGDSEELHALKGFKVLAVGNGTIGEMETFKESMNIRQNQLLPGCHYRNRTERENDMSRLIDADLLMRKCEKWLKPKAPDEDEMVSLADIAVC